MSIVVGNELPDRVLDLLGGRDGGGRLGMVVMVLTVDRAAFPHVALLSASEVLAMSRTRLALALREDGTTLRNIVERATVTVLLVEPELCCSIKGRGTAGETTIPPDPVTPFTARRADVGVAEVLLDAEPGATIESGPRYRREAPREAELDYCRRVHAALRGP